MKTNVQPGSTSAKRKARALLLRSAKSLKQDVSKHPYRWSAIALGHLWLLSMIIYNLTFAPMLVYYLAVELLFCLFTVKALVKPLKAGHIHEWALEEHKHQHVKTLTGKTAGELEEMLQYHLEQGNIEEADQVSLRLLSMAEGQNYPSPQAVSESSTPVSGNETNQGLPGWMTQENEPPPEASANLPEWMRKD